MPMSLYHGINRCLSTHSLNVVEALSVAGSQRKTTVGYIAMTLTPIRMGCKNIIAT
jgi:hypothetical protein